FAYTTLFRSHPTTGEAPLDAVWIPRSQANRGNSTRFQVFFDLLQVRRRLLRASRRGFGLLRLRRCFRHQEAFDVFYRLGQIVIFECPFYELDDFVDTDFFSDILRVNVRQNSDDLNDLIRRQIEGGDYISVQVFARGEENLSNHSGKVFRNADNLFHLGDSQFRDFNYLFAHHAFVRANHALFSFQEQIG